MAIGEAAKRSSEGVDLVASLCATYYASDEDVFRLLEKANITISKLLGKSMKDPQELQTDEHFLGIKLGWHSTLIFQYCIAIWF